jgi:hypothetical protein
MSVESENDFNRRRYGTKVVGFRILKGGFRKWNVGRRRKTEDGMLDVQNPTSSFQQRKEEKKAGISGLKFGNII